MTPIVVPVFIAANTDLEAVLGAAQATPATLIELRADAAPEKTLLEAIDLAELPVIVTVRPTWEGGRCELSDAKRADLLEAAMEAGADYVDFELAAWEKSAEFRRRIEDAAEKSGTKLIVSNHSFGGRPKDLEDRLARLRGVKIASILKMVWKAESLLDAVDALRMMRENPQQDSRPLLALAMGEQGLISRLLGAKFGAPFTFASIDSGLESAPGQPTAAELVNLYRWEIQSAEIPVCGVVGWPVGHSMSPAIHNSGFKQVSFDGVYVPLAIEPSYEHFAAAIDALRNCPGMNLRGLSVTIPHKENAVRYVRERGGTVDALSQQIGAINTIVWRTAGTGPEGFNTDYPGALDALVRAWTGRRTDLAGKRIVVLGAGGAARAIVAGLAANGADVVIHSLPQPQAEVLAAEFTGKTGTVVALPWEQRHDTRGDAWVNTTPIGMHPKTDACPIDSAPAWNSQTVVFDAVYNPLQTRFLKLAQKNGAKTVSGIEMFIGQAAIQFKAFTGQAAPTELFREVILAKLRLS